MGEHISYNQFALDHTSHAAQFIMSSNCYNIMCVCLHPVVLWSVFALYESISPCVGVNSSVPLAVLFMEFSVRDECMSK